MKLFFAVCLLSVSLFTTRLLAETPPPVAKSPPIDFTQPVKDARDKPFPLCAPVSTACPDADVSLGYVTYLALNSRPGQQAGPSGPVDVKRAALGWKIYGATGPIDVSTDERSLIKGALFAGGAVSPAMAYAACRMIVSPDECDK